ncbi:tetratricopeptide repeat protein [Streptomyces sp. SID8381]|nr:tetratricopeptide repeat protein [Streptomyces sp. SID8381]
MFEYRILGSLDVHYAGEALSISAFKERDLLALLLLKADTAVSAEELIDGLWGSAPPATARTTLQNYVKRLRRALGSAGPEHEPITTRPGGYLLQLGDGTLDLREFDRLRRAAAEAGQRGEHAMASARWRAALALWRGDALAGSRAERLVHIEAPRLNESRMAVFESWVDAELRLGRHAETVGEIQSEISRHPLRESLYVRLLLALYRSGRRGDALAAYQRIRQRLVRDLGLEPGPELAAVHQGILSGDPSLLEPVAPVDAEPRASAAIPAPDRADWVLPAQLPSHTSVFTGRRETLRRLDTMLPDSRAAASGAVRIALITGQAGAGKTTLAVHWGHSRRDRFPDGQLYTDLRGYDSGQPARPVDVLSGFLGAFGVPAPRIPAEEDRAAVLFRSLCADKRLLVVLDNASSAAQVRPLLPGDGGCLVIVTSRDHLGGLVARDGAVPVPLDVLTPAEAEELLAKVVGAARVRADPAAAAALTAACAFLPLAVGITAADLALHPDRTLADQVARLSGDSLTALQMPGDEPSAVRAVIDTSYAALASDAARMFRLLGLVPGADVPVRAAAALAGAPEAEAARLLAELTRTHLLKEHAPGRYGFHDLLRAYARERVQAEEDAAGRTAAADRLYDWYLGSVDAAGRVYLPEALRLPVRAAADAPEFADASAAAEWLDAERANIVALVRHTAEHGPWPVAWTLADAMRPYLMQRAHAGDWLSVAAAGLAAAEADDSLPGQAAAHRSLSSAHMNRSAYDESRWHDLRALDLYRRTGSAQGRSAALNSLALISWYTGRLEEALVYGEQSVEVCRAAGFQVGEAIGLGNLGAVLHETGRLADAERRLTEALDLCAALTPGLPTLAALARRNLGVVLYERGRLPEAAAALSAAADMQRDRRSHYDLAYTLFWLAHLSVQSGDRAAALGYVEQADALKTGDTRAEADLHTARALLSQSVGNHGSAVKRFEKAWDLARRCDARTQELRALTGLAESSLRLGALAEARAYAENARKTTGEGEYGLFHARALTLLAEADLAEGRADAAERLVRQALAFFAEAGHPMGTADALLVLGHVLRAAGDRARCEEKWRGALDIYESLGAVRAHEARTLLRSGTAGG